MDRTKKGNSTIISEGVFMHCFIGAILFGVLLGFEWLLGIIGLVKYQTILAIPAIIAWTISDLEKVPLNHCALKLWLGARPDSSVDIDEESDVSGEGWTIRWPFGIVTWLPFPTSKQVITIGTPEKPFAVQSGSFRLLPKKTRKKPTPPGTVIESPQPASGAIYLHTSMTVTFEINNHNILDFEDLAKAEEAMVAVLTTLTRDVILREERKKEVKDPAMVCERKDIVEAEVDGRAKGTTTYPNPPTDTNDIKAHKNLLDAIGIEVLSIKIRKIDPDPEIIKAIEQQKKEELSAKSRGTEAEGVVERIQKYTNLGIDAHFAAGLDLLAEMINIKKAK